MTDFIINDDDGQQQDEDWVLSGESNLLMNKLKQLPIVDDEVYYRDQEIYPRHKTSCTKFAYYNQRCTIFNHPGSREEIDEVEKTSLGMGRKGTGYGRSSSKGADAVRKTMGKTRKRLVNIGGEARETLMEKNRPIGISIIVDYDYRKDVPDGKLDGDTFKKLGGHADTIKRKVGEEDMYEMIDSVYKWRYDFPKDTFIKLVEDGNIRNYAYVLLPLDVIDMPELNILPPHNAPALYASNPDRKEVVVAREVEMAQRYAEGNTPLYSVYEGDLDAMYQKMDNELAIVRFYKKMNA